jgi:uncharacterized membrane protein YbhN (UPF0104 family)
LTKNTAKKIFSYLIKISILVLAFVFIYHQYLEKDNNLQQFQQLVRNIGRQQVTITMAAVIMLMLVNWTLESFKWRYLTRKLERISGWAAIEAVFCGLTWAIFTPNRLGEYAGRVLFLPNRKRIHGVFAMAVGSFGQNVITNVLGLSAVLWFISSFYHLNIWLFLGISAGAIGFMAFLLVFFFHIQWLVNILDRIPYIKKFHRFFDIMGRYTKPELINIMGFSLARFFVFSFQYYLVIHLLIPEISLFEMMMMVFVMFFVQSALPSLDLVDVAVRNGTAAYLFGHIVNQPVAVMAAVSSIWLINLIIPAILGSVFVFKLKFFDRDL